MDQSSQALWGEVKEAARHMPTGESLGGGFSGVSLPLPTPPGCRAALREGVGRWPIHNKNSVQVPPGLDHVCR